MVNKSIFSAFERLWQHVVAIVSKKADVLIYLEFETTDSEIIVNDNDYQIYTALNSPVDVICPTADMLYGAIVRITLADNGEISGFTNCLFIDGDDYTDATTGETWEFSIFNGSIICKNLTVV